MAKMNFFDGNGGIAGYTDIGPYDVTNSKVLANGDTLFTFKYNLADFPPSSDHPAKMKAVVRNAEIEDSDDYYGPSGGTIKRITFLESDNSKLFEVTGLSVDIADLDDVSDGNVFQAIMDSKNTYIGSNDSMGADGWDGDDIRTGGRRDIVKAKGGDDFIVDMGGNDKYFGGAGVDIVNYVRQSSSITVDLAQNSSTTAEGEVDQLTGIENIRGTMFSDSLLGDSKNNRFAGLDGADTMNGGGGVNELRYDKDAQYGGNAGIVANLANGTVRDGFGNIDIVQNFSKVRGTQFKDKFIDNGGNDHYRGYAGKDKFIIKGGNDTIQGGTGADKFIFKGNFGDDVIEDFAASEGDKIIIAGASDMADLSISSNANGGSLIGFGSNSIELYGIDPLDLDASSFIF